MTKTRAEAGDAWSSDGSGGVVSVDTTPAPRWIGTGRTVFSNKGLPVEQYEPYFSVDEQFDDADALVKHTVQQRRTYDALGRVIRIDHPDGTFETVDIGPWQQVNGDRNDTVLASAWFAQRQSGGAAPLAEKRAAALAAAHAATPTVSVADPLGRFVRIREDNAAEGIYETQFDVDIVGDVVAVHDARGVQIGTQVKDALGRVVRTDSVDAGTQLALSDASSRRFLQVTANGHVVRCHYDLIGRPTHTAVRDPGAPADRVVELAIYGEEHTQAAARFMVGQIHRRYDGAGMSRADRYDLAGNLVEGLRQFSKTPDGPDWSGALGVPLAGIDAATKAKLDDEIFPAKSSFDALGRAVTQHLSDGTDITLEYAGDLPRRISADVRGSGAVTPFVADSRYDARRRRIDATYGNGVTMRYDYDDESGRVVRVSAQTQQSTLQDRSYTYDPVGNVVQVDDAAAQTVIFQGSVVAPGNQYTYDATYRLRIAVGREHASLGPQPNAYDPVLKPLPHPNQPNALRRYTETYLYDNVGNLTSLQHNSTNGWTRAYDYARGTNRLVSHQLPGDPVAGPFSATFQYDAAGCIAQAPNVSTLDWDHAGRLVSTDHGGGGTISYAYDGAGNRVRKEWQRLGGIREVCLYLGDLEHFRRYRNGSLVFARSTVRILDGKRTVALVETVTKDQDHIGPDMTPHVRYQIVDVLGSTAMECDEAASPISYEEYHPFGTTALWMARGVAAISLKRYRYLGKEKDEATGYYVLGARYYSPWLGRWLSPDPMGVLDGPNRYCYASNNPTSRIDPDGFASIPVDPQVWLVESIRFMARATPKTSGTKRFAPLLRQLHEQFGGPDNWEIGHWKTPNEITPPWTETEIGVQDFGHNRSPKWRAQEQTKVDKWLAENPGRKRVGDVWKGEHGPRPGPPKPVPEIAGRGPVPLSATKPPPPALKLSPSAPQARPPEQLELRLNYEPISSRQTAFNFENPPPPQPPAVPSSAPSAPLDATKTTDALKTNEVAAEPAPVAAGSGQATEAAVAKGVDTSAPVSESVNASTTVAKDATGVADVTNEASTASEVAKDLGTAAETTKEATAVAEVTKDASALEKLAPVVEDAGALGKLTKSVAPAAKTAIPLAKRAGSLGKVVSGGAKVVKAVAPAVKLLGEVAKPLGVAMAAVDLATANNNSDRLVAAGDLAAGVAVYCGPVGEAFTAGYTVGGLADKGIEKASKAAFGVDLSPSNGLSHVMDGADKVASAVIPDDPKMPAYKNENKLAWFLIDHLGF